MVNNYETDLIHTATAEWLTQNGYQYEHEKWMPKHGRVDFYVWNAIGFEMLVECKIRIDNLDKVIGQVLGYGSQFDKPIFLALALPRKAVVQEVRRRCEKCGISIIELPVSGQFYNTALDPATATCVKSLARKHGTTPENLIRVLIATHPEIQEEAINEGVTPEPDSVGWGGRRKVKAE